MDFDTLQPMRDRVYWGWIGHDVHPRKTQRALDFKYPESVNSIFFVQL